MTKNTITQTELDNLCKALLAADVDIRDIILFGSFVYAPSLARDVDLVVTTSKRKRYDVYLDTVSDFPINVDVIVRQPGENIGDRIAWGIRAVGRVLVGDGQTLKEVMEMPAPTFERARKIFYRADKNFLDAQNNQDLDIKDEAYRDAFNKLFDVARNAIMAYLDSEETRWGLKDKGERRKGKVSTHLFTFHFPLSPFRRGRLRRALPQPFENRFRQIIDALHISYSYHGDYPKDSIDEEFERWRDIVGQFVDDLEKTASGS